MAKPVEQRPILKLAAEIIHFIEEYNYAAIQRGENTVSDDELPRVLKIVELLAWDSVRYRKRVSMPVQAIQSSPGPGACDE
jgi:hypothetical protein